MFADRDGCPEEFLAVVKRLESCDLVAGKVKPPPHFFPPRREEAFRYTEAGTSKCFAV